jgi:DNA-binding NarL/FixJ family response regulator
MIRVGVVDDHQLFSDGLAAALNAIPDIDVVATFGNGSDFLAAQPALNIDVALLDLEMPDHSGLDVLSRLNAGIKAIIVSMHEGEEQQTLAFEMGAAGYLSKAAPLSDVAAAVRAVKDGQNLLDANTTVSEILDQYRQVVLDPGAASLTPRERQVLSLMARGTTSTDELADLLFISQKTVKNHLASIYDKLAIADRAQAAVEAIRLGLDRE